MGTIYLANGYVKLLTESERTALRWALLAQADEERNKRIRSEGYVA